jgi:hypothetical protein
VLLVVLPCKQMLQQQVVMKVLGMNRGLIVHYSCLVTTMDHGIMAEAGSRHDITVQVGG